MKDNKKAYIRTDLALESYSPPQSGRESGVIAAEYEPEGVHVSRIDVINECGADEIGKPIGSYFTFTTGRLWYAGEDEHQKFVRVIGGAMKELLCAVCDENAAVLIAGLGNRDITCDAVGPLCCDRINVTRHIKTLNRELYDKVAGGECAAIAPGVIGQTGIETGEIISGIVERVRPSAVIVCDALCARASERLCSTVQLSNTGIAPGSGVGNHRYPLDRTTLGVPVFSLGVPTVVDSSTLVYDALEKAGITEPSERLIGVLENGRGYYVSLRECDTAVRALSTLCADAINYALGNNF